MSKDDFILKAEGLYKSYRMGTTDVKVLKGVDLAIKQGEFVAIVGASGSGKSTLLHILGALDRPDKIQESITAKVWRRRFRRLARCLAVLLGIGFLLFWGQDIVENYPVKHLIWQFIIGLLGAILYYCAIWFPYRLIEWLVFRWLRAKRPHKGIVKFQGRALSRLSGSDLNRFRNKMVGFVFQFYHLLDELNVLENVYLPAMASKSTIAWFAYRRWAKSRARQLLEQLGLGNRARHKPYQLSGGERQRVAIGRALMNEPRILLADEPTGNLDSATGNSILDVLERLNRAGQTIVMVTHDERIAERAGRIVTLADGKVEHKSTRA